MIFSTFLIGLYGLLLRYFRRGLQKAVKRPAGPLSSEPAFCSILLPFRNEGGRLPDLLADLRQQNYPHDRYEVILVNDHSEDDFADVIPDLPASFRLYSLPREEQGKKAALALAVNKARGELLLQTDADCRLAPNWLREMTGAYQGGAKLILGAVAMLPARGFWSRFAALDFLGLQACGLGSAAQGKAFMGSAANMAYSKSLRAQLKLRGQQTASGDDVFLIQAASAADVPAAVVLSGEGRVLTPAPLSLDELLQQRVRWGAKTTAYPSAFAKAVAAMVLTLAVLSGFWWLAACWSLYFLLYAFLFILLKALIDFPFLRYFARLSGQEGLMRVFWSASLLYPFYILYTSFLILKGPAIWKGR